MGKQKKSSPSSQNVRKSKMVDGKYCPFVSVCTPTFNRRPFIPMMFQCFKNQTYPKSCVEWIIVDDGTDKIEDLIEASGIPEIRYFKIDRKMSLGEKRNYMHTHAKGSIIVYMDDDDYYPPERIAHCVERLGENKSILVAGASEIYIYFNHIKKMIQCGPYSPNHATAGTFAFRRELLLQSKYEDHAALAEEKAFLKNYTVPMVQLDPLKTILVFSHSHNTFDKKKLLNNMHPDYCKESAKQVSDFIKFDHESNIKDFFLNDIDNLLANYKLGEPNMKPDVMEHIKKLDKERQQMLPPTDSPKIILSKPGEPSVELTHNQIIDIFQQQQQQIQHMANQIAKQNEIIGSLQKQLQNVSSHESNAKLQPLQKFNVSD